MASVSQPFYYQITPVNVKYDMTSIDLPLVTLAAGTVLFRGMKIPNPADVDPRIFYRDYLGDPEGSEQICMRPTHNVFFYPFPYVAFGAHTIGQTFDMMQMVVLVHPMTVVCSISPSQWVRGMAQRFTGNAPYRRCDTFLARCHPLTAKEKESDKYDNCLDPNYQVESGTRGWMALADLDSFKPDQKKGAENPESSMKLYLKELEKRQPGTGAELIAWSYTDHRRHNGFPEISLYPYKTHLGNKVLKRRCRNQDDAIRIMQKEAEADNLNFLPIATFTKDATIDMVKGYFMYEALGVSANSFNTPALDKQPEIEVKIREYMDLLQTTGITLPFFGKGVLSLDMRTGFYILPQVIPKTLTVPLPMEELAGGGGAAQEKSYRQLVLPLKTEQDKKHALDYILIFRNAVPSKFMEKYGLDKGFGVRRAMIFNRPPVLPRVFQELGLDVPAKFNEGIRRAAALFQKNTGAPRKTGAPKEKSEKSEKPEAKEAKEAEEVKPFVYPGGYGAGMQEVKPLVLPGGYGAGMPGGYGSLGGYGGLVGKQGAGMPGMPGLPEKPKSTTPPYAGTPQGGRTPTYAPGTPQGGRTPTYAPGTPEGGRTPQYGPRTPRRSPYFASGGSRKTKTKAKSIVKKTRKQAKKTIVKLAKEFSKVWKKFDKRKS
jgi:hypothetical protein